MEIYYIHPSEYIATGHGNLDKEAGKGRLFRRSKPRPVTNDHRAHHRLMALAEHLKFSPRQFYLPQSDSYRIALAASPFTLLVVDFVKDEAWLMPFGRIVRMGAISTSTEGQVQDSVKIEGVKKIADGEESDLKFLIPGPSPYFLEVKWGDSLEHKSRIADGGMAVWEWETGEN